MITCTNCNFKTNNISKYNRHQSLHKNQLSKFYCMYSRCCMQFRKYDSFRQHIFRSHRNSLLKLSKKDISNSNLHCSALNCNYSADNSKQMVAHVYKHLRNGTSLTCFYSCCLTKNVFHNIGAFRSHLYRNHNTTYKVKSTKQTVRNFTLSTVSGNNKGDDNMEMYNDDQESISENTAYDENAALMSLSKLYLLLKTKYFLPESTLQVITDGLHDINELSNEKKVKLINQHTKQNESVLNGILLSNDFISKAHNKNTGVLRNTYFRNQFYQQNFMFNNPRKIFLGRNETHKLCHYYYVPILETIKCLLQSSIFNFKGNMNDDQTKKIFSDICDGSVILSNIFFQNNENALQIIMYQDSFECCNPLGSSRIKYKLVGVYMTIGNIAPYHRSKVDNLQLVLLCLERDLKYFKFNKIFDTVLQDIKVLETTGISLTINNELLTFRGTLAVMLGDNLGSHQIGGFVENFSSSEFFCRYCYAKKSSLNAGDFAIAELRTIDSYKNDITNLNYETRIYNGLKSDSCLNKLKYYHVCNPGLPPCLAHDLFEGVLSYDLNLAIHYLILKNWFSYSFLNSRLQSIRFEGETNYENVPLIKRGNKLIGSACENIRLILILPIAIFDRIKKIDDDVWIMILTLREIAKLLLAPSISIGQVAYLKVLLNEYLHLRISNFPNTNLKPKHHYLLHYPDLITKFGPLKHLWTLRYESKHKYFKNILKHSPNYKNITFSLSEKHQYLQAYYFAQKSQFNENVECDHASGFIIEDYNDEMQTVTASLITEYNSLFICTKCLYRGIIYKRNQYVCFKKDEFGHNVLCEISYILFDTTYSFLFFIGNEIYLFKNKFGLHEQLNRVNKLIAIPYTQLLSPEPVLQYKQNENIFYVFKHAPLDVL